MLHLHNHGPGQHLSYVVVFPQAYVEYFKNKNINIDTMLSNYCAYTANTNIHMDQIPMKISSIY